MAKFNPEQAESTRSVDEILDSIRLSPSIENIIENLREALNAGAVVTKAQARVIRKAIKDLAQKSDGTLLDLAPLITAINSFPCSTDIGMQEGTPVKEVLRLIAQDPQDILVHPSPDVKARVVAIAKTVRGFVSPVACMTPDQDNALHSMIAVLATQESLTYQTEIPFHRVLPLVGTANSFNLQCKDCSSDECPQRDPDSQNR